MVNRLEKYMDTKFGSVEKCITRLENNDKEIKKYLEENIGKKLSEHDKDIASLKTQRNEKNEEKKNKHDLKKIGYKALFGGIITVVSVIVTALVTSGK